MIASLYWKGSPDVQRYRVWRSEPGKAPILVASNALNNVPDPTPTQVYFDLGDWWCQDTVPDPRITYSYTVTAYFANGVTASAPGVAYVSPPLNNPPGFTATYDQANNAVNLAWQEPAMQLSYQLEGPGLPGGKIVNPTLSWSIYQPPAGTLTYKVTAIYPRGFADYATATVATVTVPP